MLGIKPVPPQEQMLLTAELVLQPLRFIFLHVCLSGSVCVTECPQHTEEGIRSPGTRARTCALMVKLTFQSIFQILSVCVWVRWGGGNLVTLQEQYVFLTAKLSL